MPVEDLMRGADMLFNLNPRWCHSGPDPAKEWLPADINTAHGAAVVGNSFARWVKKGGQLEDRPYMNCWEAIFYAAYLGGCVTRQKLLDWHNDAAMEGSMFGADGYYGVLMQKGLKFDRSVEQPASYDAARGDIVFIQDLGKPLEPFKHVMLCTGGVQRAWSHDLSEVEMSNGNMTVNEDTKRNFRKVTYFAHLVPSLTAKYVARFAPFPF